MSLPNSAASLRKSLAHRANSFASQNVYLAEKRQKLKTLKPHFASSTRLISSSSRHLAPQTTQVHPASAFSSANTYSAAAASASSRRIAIVAGTVVASSAAALWTYLFSSTSECSTTTLMPPPPAMKAPFELVYPEAYEELKKALGTDLMSIESDELEQHGKEMSGYATPSNPQIVVWPESTEHVSKILKICHRYNIPAVPYAAGTSLEGHTISSRGGVCIDVKKMDKILKVNRDDMDCVVQPGVGWMQLNEYLAEHKYNMFLGVDPAPGACIGGMCATCCSGTNAVRYGTMKDQVLNLTVVMADGTIVKTGQRARKSSAGYDLARVFVGSEGTLGVVTEATLRLRNVPECIRVARIGFDSVHDACSAVIKILQEGIQLGAIELLDEEMVRAVNVYSSMSLPETPMILFKFTGPSSHVDYDIKRVREITSKFSKHQYYFTKDKTETDLLWGARKHAFWAAQTMKPGKELMATDVAVPISKLADCIMETKKELDASFLFAPIVGHVGDGNFHSVIMFDPNDPKESEEAHRLNRSMVRRAISMEGTCTGEHGIGLGKKEYLIPEFGVEAVELMKTLKRALDPKNIMNPGKIVDVDTGNCPERVN